jgi:hypothetical protein
MTHELARDASKPGWWHSYDDVLPSWFRIAVGLEESASLIRAYEPQVVSGFCRPRATSGRSAPSSTSARSPPHRRRQDIMVCGDAVGQHWRTSCSPEQGHGSL